MTLRKKTLSIIALLFVALTLVQYFLYRKTLLPTFHKLEELYTRQNLDRIVQGISYRVLRVDAKAQDKSTEESALQFAKNLDTSVFLSQTDKTSFRDFWIHGAILVQPSGKILLQKAYDLGYQEELELPQDLLAHLVPQDPLLKLHESGNKMSGIFYSTEGLMALAARPILVSEEPNSVNAILILFRWIEPADLAETFKNPSFSFSFYSFYDPKLSLDVREAREELLHQNSALIQPKSENSLVGYSLMRDLYGKPSLILRIEEPRTLNTEGRILTGYLILSFLGIIVIFTTLVLVILAKLVLSPLANLSEEVGRIGAQGNLKARLPVSGKDELANLARSVNQMLLALEESQHERLESEERFSKVFTEGPLGIALSGHDFRFMQVNPALCEMLGYTAQQFQYLRFPDVTHPEDVLKDQELSRKLFKGQIPFYRVEKRFIKQNKEVLWVNLTSSMVWDEERTPLYSLSFIEDISERKQLENIKDDFLNTVSHELRTPLSIVKGAIGNLADGILGELTEKQLHVVNTARRNVSRLARLINDLLDLSRLESGEMILRKQTVDARNFFYEVLKNFEGAFEKHQIVYEEECPSFLPTLKMDPDLMTQVFFNLLDNAARIAKKRVLIRAKVEGREVQFSVFNDGPQIPEDKMSFLFHKFRQINRPSGGAGYKGTGLGLAISRKIVELHQGKIWAENVDETGVFFHFTLPIQEELS